MWVWIGKGSDRNRRGSAAPPDLRGGGVKLISVAGLGGLGGLGLFVCVPGISGVSRVLVVLVLSL